MLMRTRQAFTLIELLIVVAIIAILAAIAVPNFLEAQTRAKVSRTKADMRTVATALEAYAVECNVYPYEEEGASFPHRLTTPVAFLSSPTMDGFRANDQGTPPAKRTLRYFRFLTKAQESRPEVAALRGSDADFECDAKVLDLFGSWAVSSFGPDLDHDSIWPGMNYSDPVSRFYDPSNGTLSNGDLARTQKQKGTNTQ